MQKTVVDPSITTKGSLASGFVDFTGLGCDVELKVDDIAVETLVVTSLLQVETFSAHLTFRSQSVQVLKLHHFSADESSLEIGVNHSGCSGCLRSLSNRPAFHLIFSRGEIVDQLESAIADIDKLMDHCRCTKRCSCLVSGMLISGARRSKHLRLKVGRVGQHRTAAIGIDPGLDLGEPLVLLHDVFVASNIN